MSGTEVVLALACLALFVAAVGSLVSGMLLLSSQVRNLAQRVETLGVLLAAHARPLDEPMVGRSEYTNNKRTMWDDIPKGTGG